MKARFLRFAGVKSRARRASTVGLFLTLFASAAHAQQGTPEQRRACTPDVYRLCAGEIPNVRAITACLRRNRPSLSEACRIVFDRPAADIPAVWVCAQQVARAGRRIRHSRPVDTPVGMLRTGWGRRGMCFGCRPQMRPLIVISLSNDLTA